MRYEVCIGNLLAVFVLGMLHDAVQRERSVKTAATCFVVQGFLACIFLRKRVVQVGNSTEFVS